MAQKVRYSSQGKLDDLGSDPQLLRKVQVDEVNTWKAEMGSEELTS